jgi:hypothetical protein
MAIDIFNVRTMLRQIEQMKPARNFLRDMFFRETQIHDTDTLDIDVIKGKRRLAPYVSPKMEGKRVERIGWTTNSVKPPYVKMKMETNAETLLNRQAGNTVYSENLTPLARAGFQLGEDLRELNDLVDRREEFQCAEALNAGTVTVSGDGLGYTVDFLMESSHKITLAGANVWSDNNSDPLKNLRTWRRLIIQDSGISPDVVILASDVVDVFLEHPKIAATLDNRRVDRGIIQPETLPNGATYLGYIFEVGCDIYSYDEWYIDPADDTEKPMVPANKVWMASTRARTTRHYGLIQDQEHGDFAVSRLPKSWVVPDPSVRWIMLQSAPLMALHQSDAFISADVL